jgi:hypothetical protein
MSATIHLGQLATLALPNAPPSSASPHVPQALISLLYRIKACQKQARAKLSVLQADLAQSRPFRSGPLAGDIAGLKQIMEDFDKWAWLMVNAIRHVHVYGYDMWVLTIHQAVVSGLEVYERCRFEKPKLVGTCRL